MTIMKKAHAIRKAAAKFWGHKVSEIDFASCLRMAHSGEKFAPIVKEEPRFGMTMKKRTAALKEAAKYWKNRISEVDFAMCPRTCHPGEEFLLRDHKPNQTNTI